MHKNVACIHTHSCSLTNKRKDRWVLSAHKHINKHTQAQTTFRNIREAAVWGPLVRLPLDIRGYLLYMYSKITPV